MPAIEHAPAAGRHHPGHDLGEGRLAGAVLPQQGMDLALAQIEVDLPHRRHAAIGFGDLLHVDQGRHGQGRRGLGHDSAPADIEDRPAALGRDEHPPARLDHAGDAMAPSIGAAVEAGDRPHRRIEPNHQPVGAAGGPGLVDAHGLDPAALQRLQEAGAGGERRRDPAIPRHLAHHIGAIGLLLEDEFDQPVARREEASARRRRRRPAPAGRDSRAAWKGSASQHRPPGAGAAGGGASSRRRQGCRRFPPAAHRERPDPWPGRGHRRCGDRGARPSPWRCAPSDRRPSRRADAAPSPGRGRAYRHRRRRAPWARRARRVPAGSRSPIMRRPSSSATASSPAGRDGKRRHRRRHSSRW